MLGRGLSVARCLVTVTALMPGSGLVLPLSLQVEGGDAPNLAAAAGSWLALLKHALSSADSPPVEVSSITP